MNPLDFIPKPEVDLKVDADTKVSRSCNCCNNNTCCCFPFLRRRRRRHRNNCEIKTNKIAKDKLNLSQKKHKV